jgi:hypothetical protein
MYCQESQTKVEMEKLCTNVGISQRYFIFFTQHLLPQKQHDVKVRNDTTITKIKNLVRAEIGIS